MKHQLILFIISMTKSISLFYRIKINKNKKSVSL
jgi:hypothetical protein